MATLRLKTVRLEEFRSFSAGTLDLSADVVAIYGRNGAGKTTVFDAIDFALFGSISRLDNFPSETDYIGRVGGTGVPKVRIEFQRGTEIPWTETCWDRAAQRPVTVDGTGGWRTHRDLLYGLLVDEEQLTGRRDVTSVREMFRATVFLSQYSIRDFIESGAEERARTLARLAGLAHIQRARDKTDRVAALVERDLRAVASELQERNDRAKEVGLAVAEVHARRDGLMARLAGSGPTVKDVRDILSHAGVTLDANQNFSQDSAVTARTLQVQCDQLSADLDARGRRLAAVESGIENQVGRIERLRELGDRRKKKQDELGALDVQHAEFLSRSTSAAKHLSETQVRVRQASESLQRTRTQADLLREAAALGDRLGREREALTVLSNSIEALKAPLTTRREQHERTRRISDEASHKAEQVKHELQALASVSDNLPRYAELLSQLEGARAELQSAEAALKDTEASVQRDQDTIRTLTAAVVAAETALSHAKVESEERGQLLSRLRPMTHGRTCPLCGKEHASDAALLQAIDNELSQVPESTKVISAQLQSDRTLLAETSRNMTVNQARRGELTGRITGLRSTLDRCQNDKATIESVAARLQIDISEPAVRLRLSAARAREQEIGTELREAAALAAQQVREIASADEEYRNCEDRLSTTNRTIAQLEDLARDVRRRLTELGDAVTSEAPTEDALAKDIDRLGADLSQAEREHLAAETAHREADERVQATARQVAEGARALRDLDDGTAALAADVQSFRSRCRDAGFDGDPTAEDLRVLRSTLDSQGAAIAKAKELAEKAELRFSLEALIPECRTREDELKAAERAVSIDTEKLNTLLRAQAAVKSWVQPLDAGLDTAIERTISSHQQEIERHFKAMVPAPHLFDSIAMRKVDSRLQLGVRYRGQSSDSGEPRMFLSNAQLNLLALAIFLSLGARQQWSHLDTLLLDDPIQHLDDLDAIAFLDTLRAVALGRFGRRRQIVISTCDRNLFQLMIQKFQPLEAVGASFSAITLVERGSAGPFVRQHGPRPVDASSRSA